MAKTKDQKKQFVTELTDKLGRAKSVVFTDYKGLTMKHLTDLRNKLKSQNAELSVTKNTLLKISLQQSDYRLRTSEDLFRGPIATLISYGDEISPIKILVKTLKDAQIGPSTTLRIKAGFLGFDYLDADSINKLSTLPSKEELRGKVVGSLASPLYGIVGVLQANIRNLVYTVDAIRIKKGGE